MKKCWTKEDASFKIVNLIEVGVLDPKRYPPRESGNRFRYKVYKQKHFPRFAITPTQKRYNSWNKIKWEYYPPIITSDEPFTQAVDL